MNLTTTTSPATERFTLAWDLGEWFPPSQLLEWLDREIGSLDWENPEMLETLKANPAYQPRLLLTLLSYAYAQGTCESEDVLALYFKDQGLRHRFPGRPPTASEIARFRKENRGLLKWCLTELFKRVVRVKSGLGEAALPAGLRSYLVDAATARLEIARDLDRAAGGAI